MKIYIIVYSNTLLVFKYLCNRANIRANEVFVSALLDIPLTTGYKLITLTFELVHGLELSVKLQLCIY